MGGIRDTGPWWPQRSIGRVVALAIYGYAAAMLMLLPLVQLLGDRTPLGMLALFGPRHLMALPWGLLVIGAVGFSRPLAALAAAGGCATLLWVGGFELPLPTPGAERALRVVSYNTDRSRPLAWRIRADLEAWDADVVALLDCKGELMDSLRAIAPTRFIESDFNCLVTKFPVTAREQIPKDFPGLPQGTPGSGGPVERYTLDANGRPLSLYVLHFQSPRDALGEVRYNRDLGRLPMSYDFRGAESRATSQWVDRSAAALIVAGDFNMTAESQIFRTDWSDLTNAFERIGVGFGHTMIAGWHRVRIDHVLSGPTLQPVAIRVLRGFPSEHQPVVVDFAWK